MRNIWVFNFLILILTYTGLLSSTRTTAMRFQGYEEDGGIIGYIETKMFDLSKEKKYFFSVEGDFNQSHSLSKYISTCVNPKRND